jgi:hypothetical protein
MAESMIASFDIDAFDEHEAEVFRLRRIAPEHAGWMRFVVVKIARRLLAGHR